MHFLTFPALVLASAAALVGADGAPYATCGAEGFSDANVDGPPTLPLPPFGSSNPSLADDMADCRAAVAKIDVNDPDVTEPSDTSGGTLSNPYSYWRVIVSSGNCKIAALDRMHPFSSGTTSPTAFSGQKTVDYANAVINGCQAPNGLVNGYATDPTHGIGVASGF
ncbi:hypothetical protein KC363_g2914 [Hortaea werneckii]|nr:hypothetical protein KC361_g5476 [Hortaea werneckii]KAI7193164.1 hypothetical protein KC363_g2914 [Hortaea werneckii]KAI7511863.1 hypothetical protein KC347_g3007 [Hortaea werneckii]